MRKLLKKLTALAVAVAMSATFTFPSEVGYGIFDGFGNAIVASAAEPTGDFTVTGGEYGTDYSYENNVLTILKSTTLTISGTTTKDRIEVADGVSANITLDGVNIDVSSLRNTAAFKIADNSTGNVTITLADDSVNKLSSGDNCAGLQKNGDGADIGKLTIQGGTNGTGMLTSKGNVNFGAGIGGGDKGSTSNIKITGGTVIASGSYDGAGIGGGNEGSASDIEITGGKVFATGGSGGAGIGGGYHRGNGSKITISGGIVTANGNYGGAGIGGGDYYGNGTDITITGGVVTANGSRSSDGGDSKGIGAGGGLYSYGSTSNIFITGGSVNASIRAAATLADGTTKVYLYKIDNATSIEIDGVSYPTTHNGENSIYPYLSVGFHTVVIGGTEKVIYMDDSGNATEQNVQTCNDLVVYGGISGDDYEYSGGVLTIKKATSLMIKNASTGSTTDRIEVTGGVSANITLAGVDIALSGLFNAALKISDESSGDVTITLAGGSVNKLKSSNYCAGLQKNGGATSGKLTITGTGTLIATGGAYAAGIGGGKNENGFNITIKNGVVSATGGQGAAGIGGGKPDASDTGEAGNIIISGGSVNATGYNRIGGGNGKEAVTPTNGSVNVYLLDIDNDRGAAITINGTAYPTSHNGEAKIYAYLPAKSYDDPNEVTVGTTTTKLCYDEENSKWLTVVDIPAADPSTFTYDGTEKTYNIAESDNYTVTGNKQTDAGEYTVTVTLNDGLIWSSGTTVQEYSFEISKAAATAPATPTASTAVEYGNTLADAGLTEGWTWEDGNSTVPQPANTYTAYKELTDDNNYDYSNLSGFTYDEDDHKLSCEVPVTVNPVTPTITITAIPDSAITGKETTVTVTATAKNPNNETLTDVPTPAISYKIGNGTETSIQNNGSFVIPADTPNGTVVTITAKTNATAQYNAKTDTKTITVADCTHPNVPAVTVWETDETYHWHKCPDCGAELDKAEHSSNAPATETSPEVCKDCGYEMNPALGHIHANHLTPVAEVPETCTTDGVKAHYECDCGKLFADDQAATEVTADDLKIEAHHSYGTEWVSDNDDDHYHVCSVCGDKTDITAHSYDNGVITTEPTEQTTGIKTYTCSECNHTKTEIVPKLDHTHSLATEYSSDETGHWYACSGCTEKVDFAAHTYGNWKITVPATAEANGKKERVCTVCGYVQEGTVIYGGDDSTGDMENATDPDDNACHADLELTDEDIINKIPLTPEELEAIENGANLEVYMVVIDYSGNVSSADKALAEAVLTGDMQIGMYIDVTLFVKVGDNDPRAVTETNGDLNITFEMPEKLINTDKNLTREYSIIRVHDGNVVVLDCAYDSVTKTGLFSTDRFSTYAIAYNDIALEEPAPEPEPEKTVYYPVITSGNVVADKSYAAAGQIVNVTAGFGYDIIVTAENGRQIAKMTEKGSFTMPASKVYVTAVQNETYAFMATAWRNSYVYSYDADMNKIKVSSTKKRGVIVTNLGEEYAGKSFTIYSGRKSTKVKVTEGEFDENGKFVFEVPDGKNYTLVVED